MIPCPLCSRWKASDRWQQAEPHAYLLPLTTTPTSLWRRTRQKGSTRPCAHTSGGESECCVLLYEHGKEQLRRVTSKEAPNDQNCVSRSGPDGYRTTKNTPTRALPSLFVSNPMSHAWLSNSPEKQIRASRRFSRVDRRQTPCAPCSCIALSQSLIKRVSCAIEESHTR